VQIDLCAGIISVDGHDYEEPWIVESFGPDGDMTQKLDTLFATTQPASARDLKKVKKLATKSFKKWRKSNV